MVKDPCSQVILLYFLYKDNNSSIFSFPTYLIIDETIEKGRVVCSHLKKLFEVIIIKIKDITDFFYIVLKDKCSKYSSLTIYNIQYYYSLLKKKLEKLPQEN